MSELTTEQRRKIIRTMRADQALGAEPLETTAANARAIARQLFNVAISDGEARIIAAKVNPQR